MTRGTIHLILPDKILCSNQFNGDMYLDGHGYKVIQMLSDVQDEAEFREEVLKFNDENFQYKDFDIYEMPYTKDIMQLTCGEEPGGPAFSDYTYWKNLSGKVFTFIDKNSKHVLVEDKGVVVFNFCRRYLKTYPNKD